MPGIMTSSRMASNGRWLEQPQRRSPSAADLHHEPLPPQPPLEHAAVRLRVVHHEDRTRRRLGTGGPPGRRPRPPPTRGRR